MTIWAKVPVVTMFFRPLLLLAALGLAFATAAEARTTDLLVRGLTEAQALYRTTTTSLRANRPAEAEAALKALVALWDETVTATIAAPPAMAARVSLFAEQMEGGRARLKRAAEALSQGRTDGALDELAPLKRDWITLKLSLGLYGLVECLDESAQALDALMVHKRQAPDLTRAEARVDIIARTAVYRYALRRCEPFAAADVIGDGDFRRQAEAIGAALDVIDSAIRLRDPALLDRVLTDLKTFDAQLTQRFGG
ncbi:hypothetical protein C8P69_10441 [Phreatobacter oligotrophus]|uniref:PilJ/NarX-like methyl-accepting chemotaxis transducer n=1 Tax=Phreatobacter oligotrophus TaxID=1122261 RepID=A0A2T4Z520_9HYPH|nr:hypothetical protein C8P69_10441 [Phreatobacter oligotrophus]